MNYLLSITYYIIWYLFSNEVILTLPSLMLWLICPFYLFRLSLRYSFWLLYGRLVFWQTLHQARRIREAIPHLLLPITRTQPLLLLPCSPWTCSLRANRDNNESKSTYQDGREVRLPNNKNYQIYLTIYLPPSISESITIIRNRLLPFSSSLPPPFYFFGYMDNSLYSM